MTCKWLITSLLSRVSNHQFQENYLALCKGTRESLLFVKPYNVDGGRNPANKLLIW